MAKTAAATTPRALLLLSAAAICTLVFARTSASSLNSSKAPVVTTRWPLCEAVGHLDLAAVADAERRPCAVRLVLGVDHDGGRRARRARQDGGLRNDQRVRHRLRDHLDAEARAWPQLAVRVGGLRPTLRRSCSSASSAGLICVTLPGIGAPSGPNQIGVVADLRAPRPRPATTCVRAITLRDVHHGDDGRAARRRLAGIERQVGDDAVDRARDPRVTELRLRRLVAPSGGVALRGWRPSAPGRCAKPCRSSRRLRAISYWLRAWLRVTCASLTSFCAIAPSLKRRWRLSKIACCASSASFAARTSSSAFCTSCGTVAFDVGLDRSPPPARSGAGSPSAAPADPGLSSSTSSWPARTRAPRST